MRPLLNSSEALRAMEGVSAITPRRACSDLYRYLRSRNLATRFTHADAVDVWDAQFRLRVGNELRDHTVDATWERVARAVAATETNQAGGWARRYVEAFSDWRLLPDERILRSAGTGVFIGSFEHPRALLNAGAFVLHPRTSAVRFDVDRFTTTAGLAVRLLDDAVGNSGRPIRPALALHIGMLGVADAIAALDLRYNSAQALVQVEAMAQALATGCLRGSIDLARERGSPLGPVSSARIATWERRRVNQSMIDDAKRWGVRHSQLTAIEMSPNLAMLANRASDALDPAIAQMERHRKLARISARATSSGLISTGLTPAGLTPAGLTSAGADEQIGDDISLLAQIAWRGAAQPWIDVPISYPLSCDRNFPDSPMREACLALARSCGLPQPAFRFVHAQELVSSSTSSKEGPSAAFP